MKFWDGHIDLIKLKQILKQLSFGNCSFDLGIKVSFSKEGTVDYFI